MYIAIITNKKNRSINKFFTLKTQVFKVKKLTYDLKLVPPLYAPYSWEGERGINPTFVFLWGGRKKRKQTFFFF